MRCRTCSSATRCGTAIRPRSSTAAERTRTASRSSRTRWWPGRAARRGPPQGRRLPRRRVSPSRSPTSTGPRARSVEVRRADFVIVRTGQMEDRLAEGRERGGYAGGPAPGLAFETLDWIHGAADRGHLQRHLGNRGPPERHRAGRVPALALGHNPRDRHRPRRDLLSRGARRRLRGRPRLRVFFCAPPLVITRGTGSPINPQAIK